MALRRFTIHTEYTEEELERIRNGEQVVIVPDNATMEAQFIPESQHHIVRQPTRLADNPVMGDPIRISTGYVYNHVTGNWSTQWPILSITGTPILTGGRSGNRESINTDYLRVVNCRMVTSSNITENQHTDALIICGTTGAKKIQYFVRYRKRIFSEYAFYNGLIAALIDAGTPEFSQLVQRVRQAIPRSVHDDDMLTYIRRA